MASLMQILIIVNIEHEKTFNYFQTVIKSSEHLFVLPIEYLLLFENFNSHIITKSLNSDFVFTYTT